MSHHSVRRHRERWWPSPLDLRQASARGAILLAVAAVCATPPAVALGDSIGEAPLSDRTVDVPGDWYLGSGEPGLYPGGANQPSGFHLMLGASRTAMVVPRDAEGVPAAEGWIGFVAVGMSNANQKWARFERASDLESAHGSRVVLLGLAQGGVDALRMADPADVYWSAFDARLVAAGLDPDQVQVVWLEQSLPGGTSGQPFPQQADLLREQLRLIVPLLVARCPQIQVVYLSSRAYAGWSGNGEPLAFETGFAVKGLIQDQIDDVDDLQDGPWLGWGPYLWADGATPRADGFAWAQADFEADGVHPGEGAEAKAAELLADFLAADPLTASWIGAGADAGLRVVAASDDAHVDGAAPATAAGLSPSLVASLGTEIYLKFAMPPGFEPIVRAKLSLRVDADAGTGPADLYLGNHDGWDEATITFAGAPGHAAASLVRVPGASRGGAVSIDVTTAVQAAQSAAAAELTLVLAPLGGTGAFDSRQSAEPPRLVLTVVGLLFADGFESGSAVAWAQ